MGGEDDLDLHDIILRNMAEGVCVVRVSDSTIVYANPRFEQMFGYDPGELQGCPASVLNHEGGDRSAEQTAIQILNQLHQEGEARFETHNVKKDGTPFWTRGRASAFTHPRFGRVWVSVQADVTASKQAEEQLRAQERLLRTVIDVLPVGLWITDVRGTIQSGNPAGQRIWRGARYVGPQEYGEYKGWWVDSGKPIAAHEWALARAVQRGETSIGELVRIQCFDGSFKTILNSATPIRAEDGSILGAIVVNEDVTHLKEAEARFAGIVSTASDAILSIDEAQRITFFNQGAEDIFGYTQEELLGAPLDVLIPERLREAHRIQVQEYASETPSSRMARGRLQLLAQRKGGEEFPAEVSISKMESAGQQVLTFVLRDMTERKRMEDEQRLLAEAGLILTSSLEYEATLTNVARLAVRSLADYCALDILEEDGRVRRLAVAAADKSNSALADALQFYAIDHSQPHLSSDALATGKAILYPEVTDELLQSLVQDKDHLKILRLLGLRSLMAVPLAASGKTFGALLLLSSHPHRRYGPVDLRLAEELSWRAALAIDHALLYKQAQQATRARDEVLGIVAHDLRNPLNSIALSTLALLQRLQALGLDARGQAAAESVLRSTEWMDRLIQDLLDVGRIEAGTLHVSPSPLSPQALAAELLETIRPLAAAHSLRVHLAEHLPDVLGDRGRILQVLMNLVSNAIKFTPTGGEITLGAEPRPDGVCFWVADKGPGIRPEHQEHIFDWFWQAEQGDRRGAGLGLAICKGIIKAHKGKLWVESRLGEGSIFFFTLPFPSLPQEHPKQAPS
jgi:PAS domain S-box-containing protein